MDISIVIPLYNEEESLPELISWIERVVLQQHYQYEIILIDDGSTDNSWSVIESLQTKNQHIRGIKFQRNYGKSAALFCGFAESKGNVVITMDADLQDSPDEIPALYQKITEENYDLVSGWKKKRYDPLMKTIPSKLFNATARLFTGIHLHDFNCGLKAYKSKVIKSIEVYGEMHRYIPVLARRAGFKKIGEKVVIHQARKYGVTKFGLERFINGYLDLLSVIFITKFAKKPMHFFGVLGSLMFLLGLSISLYLGIDKIISVTTGHHAKLITDQPMFYIALTSMMMGLQLFLSGYLGELIARSASDRNIYMIEKKI